MDGNKTQMHIGIAGLKEKALHGAVRFAGMFVYLWSMFILFQLHEYVVLAQHGISFTRLGFGLVNAFVLAKVMMFADEMKLGAWRGHRPLAHHILFRSVLFAAVFILFDIAEKLLVGAFQGKSMAESLPTFGGGGMLGTFLVGIFISVALIPFFSFVEISRAMGPGKFANLLFTSGGASPLYADTTTATMIDAGASALSDNKPD
jgi:hypothetical protein